MGEWLLPWALLLEQSGVGTAVRTSTWIYPAAEIGHLIGLGLLVGTAVAFDFRLLGAARGLPVNTLAGHLLPIARAGFGVSVVTGALLFAANATALLTSVFAVKLMAIALGVLNASLFDRGVFRSVGTWNVDASPPGGARAAAVVSLLSWLVALACGRLLAYV